VGEDKMNNYSKYDSPTEKLRNDGKKTTKFLIVSNKMKQRIQKLSEVIEDVLKTENYQMITAQMKTESEKGFKKYQLQFTQGNVRDSFYSAFNKKFPEEIELEIKGEQAEDISTKINKAYKKNKKTTKLILEKDGKIRLEK